MNFQTKVSDLTDKKAKKILLGIVIFFFAFVLRFWHLNDVGRAWDEQFVVEDGYQFIELAKKRDFGNNFWWKENPDHPVLVRYIHGLTSQFYVMGKQPNGKPIFPYDLTYDRLISVLLTSIAVVLVAMIGFRYVSLFVGTIAGIILAMLPVLLGHSQLALYEAFVIFFFTATVYSFFLFLESPTKKKVIITGVLLGLSVQAKETNLLLAPLFLLFYFVYYSNAQKKRPLKEMLTKIVCMYIIGAVTFFAIWPMPLFHLDYMINYIHQRRFETNLSIPEVFFGKLILVPKIYYIVYFLITTPFLIILLFLAGLLKINRKKSWILYAIVVWFVFPFIQSLYHNRQHGIRYIIEIYSPLALIAAIGFDSVTSIVTKNVWKKSLLFIPLFLYLLITLMRIAPYYLDYFNGLVGGINTVYEKKLFQMGWWGQGIREAAYYVEKIAPKGSKIGLILSPPHVMPSLNGLKLLKYDKNDNYDFVIVNYYSVIREGFNKSELSENYRLIHTVNVDKAHLVDIFKAYE